MKEAAVRVMQLIPESLECTETCETPDAMDFSTYVTQVSCYVQSVLVLELLAGIVCRLLLSAGLVGDAAKTARPSC